MKRTQRSAERITDPLLTGAGGTLCCKLAREAIERLFEVCPTDEIRLDRPIQRLLRDLIAVPVTRPGGNCSTGA